VGQWSVALHGDPRYTAGLDVWLAADARNADAVLQALDDFGFGELGLTSEDFTTTDRIVQLGYPPLRMDLLTSIDGVDFDRAHEHRVEVEIGQLLAPFISLSDLRRNKEASGRLQDLADLEALPDAD
jgi:hypothetical protein